MNPTYSKWFEPRGYIQTIRLHFHTKVYTRYFNVFSRLHFLFTTKRFVPDTCVNKNARSQDNAYYDESWFYLYTETKRQFNFGELRDRPAHAHEEFIITAIPT